jgi:hypothetical protein
VSHSFSLFNLLELCSVFEDWYLPAFASVSLQPLIHILALADKYAIEKILQPFAFNAEGLWPSDLQQWDSRQRRMEVVDVAQRNGLLPEPASAIRLARQSGLSTILPVAFYHLSRLPFPNDRNELRRPTSVLDRPVQWELLSAQDLLCLIGGRKLLLRATADVLSLNSFPACCSQPFCNVTGFSVKIVDTFQNSDDILGITLHYLDNLDDTDEVCSACLLKIRNHLTSFREDLWEQLPNFFLAF